MALRFSYLVMAFCFTSITVTRLVISLYALDLGAAPVAMGALYATFYIFPLLLSWPIGAFSDRIGTRWPLALGALCGAIAMLVPYFVPKLAAFYVAGALLGLAFSFFNVLLLTLVGVLSPPEDRARNFSNASMLGSVANFVGPLLAGFAIDYTGHANASLGGGAMMLVPALLLVFFGGVLPAPAPGNAVAAKPAGRLVDRAMVPTLAASALVQLGQDAYQLYLPIYGHARAMSGSTIGTIIATFAAASFLARFTMPSLVRRLGEERVLALSFVVAAAGFALIPLFEAIAILCLVSFVIGLGMGNGQPITSMLIFGRSTSGRSGAAMGLRQTTNNVMRIAGPSLFGVVATALGLSAVFWLNAGLLGLGGWLAHRTRARP